MCSVSNNNHELISDVSYAGAHQCSAQETLYCARVGKHLTDTGPGAAPTSGAPLALGHGPGHRAAHGGSPRPREEQHGPFSHGPVLVQRSVLVE